MLQMIHSLHLHRLKTDHADNKLVCNLSVLGKTDLLQICCRSAGFVRAVFSMDKFVIVRKRSLFRAGEAVDDIREGLWIFGKCCRRGYRIST